MLFELSIHQHKDRETFQPAAHHGTRDPPSLPMQVVPVPDPFYEQVTVFLSEQICALWRWNLQNAISDPDYAISFRMSPALSFEDRTVQPPTSLQQVVLSY
jgi:hypothetical protein